MNECYSIEVTEKYVALGIGYMRYSADSILVKNISYSSKIRNDSYKYVSESYFVTAGYSEEYIRYMVRIGYGIETQNQDKYGGILFG